MGGGFGFFLWKIVQGDPFWIYKKPERQKRLFIFNVKDSINLRKFSWLAVRTVTLLGRKNFGVQATMSESPFVSAARQYANWEPNPTSKGEIKALLDQYASLTQNSDQWKSVEADLKTRFTGRIAFGTAGLRGEMKPGYIYMNELTVLQASQVTPSLSCSSSFFLKGLCAYLLATPSDATSKGVVVGYDGRHNSSKFARITAATFLSKGIPVYFFREVVPTPYVVSRQHFH